VDAWRASGFLPSRTSRHRPRGFVGAPRPGAQLPLPDGLRTAAPQESQTSTRSMNPCVHTPGHLTYRPDPPERTAQTRANYVWALRGVLCVRRLGPASSPVE
jgi:hypothetical protein